MFKVFATVTAWSPISLPFGQEAFMIAEFLKIIWQSNEGRNYRESSKRYIYIYFFYTNHPLQGFKSHCSVRGYKLLLQQKLIDPPLECCEIVICWKAFIGEGVPNGCGSRKKA